MSTLPPIEPPDNFERGVHTRSLLGGMPSVPPPATFDENVLRAVHRPSVTMRHIVVTLAFLALLGGIMWWTLRTPEQAPQPQIAVPADTVVKPALTAPAADTTATTTAVKPKKKRTSRPKQPVAGY